MSKAMQNMVIKAEEVKARKVAQLKRTAQVIDLTMSIVQNAEMRGMDAPEVMAVTDWLNGVKAAVEGEIKTLEPQTKADPQDPTEPETPPPADITENNEVPQIQETVGANS